MATPEEVRQQMELLMARVIAAEQRAASAEQTAAQSQATAAAATAAAAAAVPLPAAKAKAAFQGSLVDTRQIGKPARLPAKATLAD